MDSREKTLIVSSLQAGTRLDVFLSAQLGLSRSEIRRAIVSGGVFVNSAPRKPHYPVKTGETVSLQLPEKNKKSSLLPAPLPLDVIFEDDCLVVINKPAGLSVHPGAGRSSETTLASGLLGRAGHTAALPSPDRPGIVHRLDKDTSGCLVIAKTDEAYLNLKMQFQERKVEKIYRAIVCGAMEKRYMKIELPIMRHPVKRRKMAVAPKGSGRASLTEISLLETCAGFSLVEAKPHTGRTHQIRVHLAAAGHPVLGDKTYGRKKVFPDMSAYPKRQMLHAAAISIIHPKKCIKLFFDSPLPEDFKKTWDTLNSLETNELKP